MSTYLTHDEVTELTGKTRPTAQVRALQAMKVPHLVRGNGSPAVARKDARPWDGKVKRPEEPNFGAIRHGT